MAGRAVDLDDGSILSTMVRVVIHSKYQGALRWNLACGLVCLACLFSPCQSSGQVDRPQPSLPPAPARVVDGLRASKQRQILVLNSEGSLLPLISQLNRDLVEAIKTEFGRDTEVLVEWLDLSRFHSKEYEGQLVEFLARKYHGQSLAGVVAVTEMSLRFAAAHRERLFPGTPVVHVAVRESEATRWNKVPGIYGAAVDYDPVPTIKFALEVHPGLKRVVVITGTAPFDRLWEGYIRMRAGQLEGRLQFDFWAGLSMAEIRQRLAGLAEDTVVLSPSLLSDGAGEWMIGGEALEKIAEVSPRPVYSVFAQRAVEVGAFGGIGPDYSQMGPRAARLLALAAAGQPVPLSGETAPSRAWFNWPQLKRWGIQESQLPPQSVVMNRVPTFLEAYWGRALTAVVIILVQSAFITALLIQWRRRQRAEEQLAVKRDELAHLTRVSLLGEISGTLSHELSQPLAAIKLGVEAAQMHVSLQGEAGETGRLLQNIARANDRACGLLDRVRSMIRREPPSRRSIDFNESVREVLALMRGEFSTRKVTLIPNLTEAPLAIQGDPVQIQQVLVNLMLNGVEAMAASPAGQRRLGVETTSLSNGTASLVVRDQGPGFTPEVREKLFEPFFTTKKTGLGIGMSICKQIAEDHGGSIQALNAERGGATIRLVLPLTP